LFLVILCITGAVAGGGHHRHGGGGGVAVQPIIVAAPQPLIVAAPQPYVQAPRYIQAAPRFAPPIHSYAPQRTIIQPVIQRHIVQQPIRRTVVQPVQRTIIQPVEQTIVQPVQRTVIQPVETIERYVEPLGYESEMVEEKVFRTPISKTVTELPDDVRRIKKTTNQHFPMVHEQVTNHYTIQDEQENNVIHHYYDPQNNYLGMREGRKFSGGTKHVEHPQERFEMSEKFSSGHVQEMLVEEPHTMDTTSSRMLENMVDPSYYETAQYSTTRTKRAAPSTVTMENIEYMDMEQPVLRSSLSGGSSRSFRY